MLKRMVMCSGGGAGGKRRADGLRGSSGRFSRGGLVGEAEDGVLLPLAPARFALLMVMLVGDVACLCGVVWCVWCVVGNQSGHLSRKRLIIWGAWKRPVYVGCDVHLMAAALMRCPRRIRCAMQDAGRGDHRGPGSRVASCIVAPVRAREHPQFPPHWRLGMHLGGRLCSNTNDIGFFIVD